MACFDFPLPVRDIPQWTRRLKLLTNFSLVQLGIQFVTASSGFLLVRVLNKAEFAAFTLAASLLTTLNVLTDSGIGTGLNAVGGRVWRQREQLSRLIATALVIGNAM